MKAIDQPGSTQVTCLLILQLRPKKWPLSEACFFMVEVEVRVGKPNHASTLKAPDRTWQVSCIPDIPLVKVCHMASLKGNEAGMYIPLSVCAGTSHDNRWEYILQRSRE